MRVKRRLCCRSGRDSSDSECDVDDAYAAAVVERVPSPFPATLSPLRGSHIKAVPGLRVIYDVMSVAEENEALAFHFHHRGVPANNIHRAQQFGWRFHSCGRPLEASDKLSPIPSWAVRVVQRLLAADEDRLLMPSEELWGDGVLNALVNEYRPGEELLRHIDDKHFWTGFVLGISLGSGVTMTFSQPTFDADGPSDESVDVWLPPRSCYVMTHAARYSWRHEIRAASFDTVDGVHVARGHRTSLTLRGIAPRWLPPPRSSAAADTATDASRKSSAPA